MEKLIFVLMGISFFLAGCGMDCSNDVVKTVQAPDKAYKAIAFIRNCGATTDCSPQVSILKRNQRLGKSGGNVFIGNHSTFIDVYWKDANTLVIIHDCSEEDIFLQKEKVGTIQIMYTAKPQG